MPALKWPFGHDTHALMPLRDFEFVKCRAWLLGLRTEWMYMRTAWEKATMATNKSTKLIPRTTDGEISKPSVRGSSLCKGSLVNVDNVT